MQESLESRGLHSHFSLMDKKFYSRYFLLSRVNREKDPSTPGKFAELCKAMALHKQDKITMESGQSETESPY